MVESMAMPNPDKNNNKDNAIIVAAEEEASALTTSTTIIAAATATAAANNNNNNNNDSGDVTTRTVPPKEPKKPAKWRAIDDPKGIKERLYYNLHTKEYTARKPAVYQRYEIAHKHWCLATATTPAEKEAIHHRDVIPTVDYYYRKQNANWQDVVGRIEKFRVIIAAEVTELPPELFDTCTNLVEILFLDPNPHTRLWIGHYAFRDCINLRAIQFGRQGVVCYLDNPENNH